MKIIWNEEPTAPEAPFFAAPKEEEAPKTEEPEMEAEKPKGFLPEKPDKR